MSDGVGFGLLVVILILVTFAVLVAVLLWVVSRAERHRASAGLKPGQPPPARPPRTPRKPIDWFRRVWIAAGVVVLIAAGRVAIAYWPHGDLDTATIESEVVSWIEDQAGPKVRVTADCPDTMPIKQGAEYHCVVTDQTGYTIRVTITVENDDGDVTMQAG